MRHILAWTLILFLVAWTGPATAQDAAPTETASQASPAPATASGPCDSDASCGPGAVCYRNACRKIACQDSGDCENKDICVGYQCFKPFCQTSSDCWEGSQCVSGKCYEPIVERVGRDERVMVMIPGGDFIMGSPRGDASGDELPPHHVEINGFWMDRYEVSAGHFQACIDAGGCKADEVKTSNDWKECTLGDASRKDMPINCVSWIGAKQYCEWAGKRLPSEAEWERALGGDPRSLFMWGNSAPKCERICAKEDDVPGCGTGIPCRVGSKPRDISAWGVYDMAGNVSEWTADVYDAFYYQRSPRLRPPGPPPPKTKRDDDNRVNRGGNFTQVWDRFRRTDRSRLKKELRSIQIGVRCAKNL